MGNRRILIVVSIPALVCILIAFLVIRTSHIMTFVSCDNHASFLAKAVEDHISKHGWLPYKKGMENDKALCTLDSMWTEAAINCNLGAPEALMGGWQYVHVPPQSWESILTSLGKSAEYIPIAWCGKPHRPWWPSGKKARKVIILRMMSFKPLEYIHAYNRGDPKPASLNDYVSIWQMEMDDDALGKILDRINGILAQCGDKPIAVDIR